MRGVREVGGLRLAALLVAGIGALVGLVQGLLMVSIFLLVGLVLGTNSYLYLFLGSEGATVVSSGLGLAGAGLAMAGRRLAGVSLLLVGAAGTAAFALLYTLLLPSAMPPEEIVGPPAYPTLTFYLVWLVPVPTFLVAAALFLFAHRTQG